MTSSTTSAPPIGFDYRASRRLMLALGIMAVLAMVATALSALPTLWQGLLMLAVGVASGWQLQRMRRPRVRTLLWRADGSAQLKLHRRAEDAPRETTGRVHAAHVTGPLITLKLRWPDGGRETLWLTPDNLDADTRRRLRMRLRAQARAGAAEGP